MEGIRAVVAVAAVAWANYLLATSQAWQALVVAAALAGLAAVRLEAYQTAVQWVIQRILEHRLLVASTTVPVLMATAVLIAWLPNRTDGPPPQGCPQPVELPILASIDSLEPVRELARGYEHWTARNNTKDRQCPTVHTFVYPANDGPKALTALVAGWRDNVRSPEITIGPRPDVWIPDSSVDVNSLFELANRLERPVPVAGVADLNRSIASSPMVLVTAEPGGGGDRDSGGGDGSDRGSSDPDGTPWRTLLTQLLDAPDSRVLMADLETATPALLAAGIYLRGATASTRLSLPEARQRQQRLARSGAVTGENSVAMLCRVRTRQAGPPPALIISRQLWQRFVADKPLGPGCAIKSEPVTTGTVVRPADTAILDYPFVGFTWTGDKQREVVAEFREWLSGPDSDAVRDAAGLDPRLTDPPQLCTVAKHSFCVPDDLAATISLHRQAKRPGRVLLAVDRSGSMADQIGRRGATRFTIAGQGIAQSLGQMGPLDEFGLWTFPRDASGRGHTELAPVSTGDAAHRQKAMQVLRDQSPVGDTPLYDTVLAGMARLAQIAKSGEERSTALVVLTDGSDTTSGKSLGDVAAKVARHSQTAGVQLFVITIGDASCEGPRGLSALTEAGRGVCYETDPGRLPGTTDQLFNLLWRGQ